MRRSVLRDHRAAELVVHADRDEIDVLTDAVGARGHAGRRGEGKGTILHEQVIVFHRGRPVRSEAVLEADADGAAPAGVVAGAASGCTGGDRVDAVAIVRHSRTALDVEQDDPLSRSLLLQLDYRPHRLQRGRLDVSERKSRAGARY
jgi:hypothetical protein